MGDAVTKVTCFEKYLCGQMGQSLTRNVRDMALLELAFQCIDAVRRPTPPAHRAQRPTHAASERGGDGAPHACVAHRRPAPSLSLCPPPVRSDSRMADEQTPMEQVSLTPS